MRTLVHGIFVPSVQAHLNTSFAAEEFRDFGHRNQIRCTIVGEMIVEAAMDLSEKRKTEKKLLIGAGPSSVSTGERVSLRALLGKPPYGAV